MVVTWCDDSMRYRKTIVAIKKNRTIDERERWKIRNRPARHIRWSRRPTGWLHVNWNSTKAWRREVLIYANKLSDLIQLNHQKPCEYGHDVVPVRFALWMNWPFRTRRWSINSHHLRRADFNLILDIRRQTCRSPWARNQQITNLICCQFASFRRAVSLLNNKQFLYAWCCKIGGWCKFHLGPASKWNSNEIIVKPRKY